MSLHESNGRDSAAGAATDAGGSPTLDVEHAVSQRYSAASHEAEPSLCCPVDYDPKYLDVLGGGNHRTRLRLRRPLEVPPAGRDSA